jgi:hypothetical protein
MRLTRTRTHSGAGRLKQCYEVKRSIRQLELAVSSARLNVYKDTKGCGKHSAHKALARGVERRVLTWSAR